MKPREAASSLLPAVVFWGASPRPSPRRGCLRDDERLRLVGKTRARKPLKHFDTARSQSVVGT